ncbi:MAG: NADP-dependent oxidoreductase, partial [Phycisphaerales bacterium]|nr:NADP-dependent oxidoreductase [Phycisphaerales bacterium]
MARSPASPRAARSARGPSSWSSGRGWRSAAAADAPCRHGSDIVETCRYSLSIVTAGRFAGYTCRTLSPIRPADGPCRNGPTPMHTHRPRPLSMLAVLAAAALLAGSASDAAPPAAPGGVDKDAKAAMKAVRMHDYGDASKLVFEDAPKASPAGGELLVRVRAAGVNPVDWKIRSGMFRGGIDFAMPATLGFDIAGEVEAVGEGVTTFRTGDPVFAYVALNRGGGYAQFAIAKASEAARMPAGLDMASAGATPLVALTAWQALFDQGKLAKGQTVLIHGGAGGVGHMAVQL